MGRPRQFDEKVVLDAATDVFWTKGYEATSTRDLSDCMGLTHASLYNAFGDKRALFIRALDNYLDRSLRERITRVEATFPPDRAIVAFLHEVVERSLGDAEQRGCMLVNSALEARSDDPELRSIVAAETTVIEDFFRRSILAAQKTGEISLEVSADDSARLLLSAQLGLRVLARVRSDRPLIEGIARSAVATLGLTWPSQGSEPDG